MITIRPLIALVLMFTWMQAQASYMFSCDLTGVVVSEPKHLRLSFADRDETRSTFLFSVSKAVAGGRADSSCEQTYRGKIIEVTLNNANFDLVQLRKQLHLNYFIKDWAGITKRIKRFQLLNE